MSSPYELQAYEEAEAERSPLDGKSLFDLCWITALLLPIFAIRAMGTWQGRRLFEGLARALPPEPEARTGWELPREPKGPEHPRTGWDEPER